MKKALITYNSLFLILGNVLFSNLHHHDHHHDHDLNHSDCEECLIIENSGSYVSDCAELNLPNNSFSKFISEFISTFEWLIEKTYLSRAPPIS